MKKEIKENKIKKFFMSNPIEILDKQYDWLAIMSFGIVWVFYVYIPYALTLLIKPNELQFSKYEHLELYWIPGSLITLCYLRFPEILQFNNIWKIFLFGVIASIGFALHIGIVGFGIIDLAWFLFYYGSLGLIIFVRRLKRDMLETKKKVEENIHKYDRECILSIKADWSFYLNKFLQVYLAVGTILGVCMTILLSGTTKVNGIEMPSWTIWGRMTNAVRMASLFLMESGLLFLFFVAPLFEIIGSFQKMLINTKAKNK